MNIGYLIKFKWDPPKGGASVHAYQVATNLVKRGHRLHTIYYHHPNLLAKVYRQRELFQFLNAIDVLYIRVDGDFGYEIFTLLKFLKLKKLPVIWEINSPLKELLVRGKTERYVAKLQRKRAFLARFVDAAICVSKENEKYAREDLRIKNTHVVPNGSDTELFSPAKKDPKTYQNLKGKFKLVWMGSAQYKWHGLDLINSVAAKIRELDKEIAFILIGDQHDLTANREWTSNISIIYDKEYLQIPPYIASADAGLCLYNNEGLPGEFYFSPLKLFDFMACGLPVIATGVGQIGEVIQSEQEGVLVKNDADEIVEKILLLKNDPHVARQMGDTARKKTVEFYNWVRVGLETEKILQALFKENK